MDRPLFKRSKAGAELTPAGTEFERFAYGHIKLWEERKQRVAILEGFNQSLTVILAFDAKSVGRQAEEPQVAEIQIEHSDETPPPGNHSDFSK